MSICNVLGQKKDQPEWLVRLAYQRLVRLGVESDPIGIPLL